MEDEMTTQQVQVAAGGNESRYAQTERIKRILSALIKRTEAEIELQGPYAELKDNDGQERARKTQRELRSRAYLARQVLELIDHLCNAGFTPSCETEEIFSFDFEGSEEGGSSNLRVLLDLRGRKMVITHGTRNVGQIVLKYVKEIRVNFSNPTSNRCCYDVVCDDESYICFSPNFYNTSIKTNGEVR